MSAHELVTEGPVAYPGGKNGWFRVHCTCDPARFWWGDTEIRALKSGARDHKKAKDNAPQIAAAKLQSDYRTMVLWWLTSPTVHLKRPDLATALRKGDTVTLSYQQLYEIIDTVRHNSTPRG